MHPFAKFIYYFTIFSINKKSAKLLRILMNRKRMIKYLDYKKISFKNYKKKINKIYI